MLFRSLKLDCSKLKRKFRWKPVWDAKKAIDKTVEWSVAYQKGEDILECMEGQIREFVEEVQQYFEFSEL